MPLEMQARGSVNVGIRDHHDQAAPDFLRLRIAVAANHSFSFDHRRRPGVLRTAGVRTPVNRVAYAALKPYMNGAPA